MKKEQKENLNVLTAEDLFDEVDNEIHLERINQYKEIIAMELNN